MSKNIFVVSGAALEPGSTIKMKSAAFKERQHLQEWLLLRPGIIEYGFKVLTSEFDQWQTPLGDRQSDRLDILGIDEDGRLVVVELKRGPCLDTTDMQAIKYAALCSQFTVGRLLEAHRDFLERDGKIVSVADLHAEFRGRYKGYDDLEEKVGVPRIILIAESFPPNITSTAVFLSGLRLPIKLIQFEVTRFESMSEGTYTIAFDTLFPPSDMDAFISTPRTPTQSQLIEQEVAEREARQQNIVAQIVGSGLIPSGGMLTFRPPYKVNGADEINAWLVQNSDGHAAWINDVRRPLSWNGEAYSPTGLAKRIIHDATGNEPRSLRGPEWWTYNGRTLVELAMPGE